MTIIISYCMFQHSVKRKEKNKEWHELSNFPQLKIDMCSLVHYYNFYAISLLPTGNDSWISEAVYFEFSNSKKISTQFSH